MLVRSQLLDVVQMLPIGMPLECKCPSDIAGMPTGGFEKLLGFSIRHG